MHSNKHRSQCGPHHIVLGKATAMQFHLLKRCHGKPHNTVLGKPTAMQGPRTTKMKVPMLDISTHSYLAEFQVIATWWLCRTSH